MTSETFHFKVKIAKKRYFNIKLEQVNKKQRLQTNLYI